MSPVSRGFRHLHAAPAGQESRLPPGQHLVDGFPVLSAGPTPHTPLERWTFAITQGGQLKKSWTWQELHALPVQTSTADIHCVTRWSKFGTRWQGVSVDTLLGQAGYAAPYVMAFCDGGYTTNLPIADVTGGQALVAFGYEGEPLAPEHGGPARLLYSSRSWEDVIYRDELGRYRDGVQVSYTLTRRQPPGWTGHAGRIDAALLAETGWPAAAHALAYICGPTSFVETAAAGLVGLGYPPERVKTERFGATGGR